MHLPPPGLPRFGGGERPPFLCKPIAPLTITMSQRLAAFAGPNIPRAPNCRPALARPSEPLFRLGKGGGGKGQMLPQATLGAILCAVRIDFQREPKINPYPAQPATGVLGQRPKRVLLTFARTKVSPRRVGVQIIIFCKTCPAEGARSLCHVHPPTGKETIPKIKRAARRNHSFFMLLRGYSPSQSSTLALISP